MIAAPLADRTAIADDGAAVTLALYHAAEIVAAVELDGLRALWLGHRLIEAGLRRLAANGPTPQPSARRRGGDPRPDNRARRDAALRDLACLIGADLSLEQRAARIVDKATRYRPAPADQHGDAERQALARIAAAGLPVPGRRHVRRILAKQKLV